MSNYWCSSEEQYCMWKQTTAGWEAIQFKCNTSVRSRHTPSTKKKKAPHSSTNEPPYECYQDASHVSHVYIICGGTDSSEGGCNKKVIYTTYIVKSSSSGCMGNTKLFHSSDTQTEGGLLSKQPDVFPRHPLGLIGF